VVVMALELPKNLNLLQPAENPVSTWDRIYIWVFTVGRYVIIVVEMIVLLAFASRFTLDRKNNDLTDSIDVKVQMLKSQSETETTLRRVQSTLDNFSDMLDNQEVMSQKLQAVLEQIPPSIDVDTFSMNESAISMSCRAPNYEIIHDLERSLREDPEYAEIDIWLNKSGSEASEVDFTIRIDLPSGDDVRASSNSN